MAKLREMEITLEPDWVGDIFALLPADFSWDRLHFLHFQKSGLSEWLAQREEILYAFERSYPRLHEIVFDPRYQSGALCRYQVSGHPLADSRVMEESNYQPPGMLGFTNQTHWSVLPPLLKKGDVFESGVLLNTHSMRSFPPAFYRNFQMNSPYGLWVAVLISKEIVEEFRIHPWNLSFLIEGAEIEEGQVWVFEIPGASFMNEENPELLGLDDDESRPRVQVSRILNWQTCQEWMRREVCWEKEPWKEELGIPDELQSDLLEEESLEAQASLLTRYVAEGIRSFATGLSFEAWPNEVLRRGYGNPLEKAVLLKALLVQHQIPCTLMMASVNASSMVPSELPHLDFPRPLVSVELTPGQRKILDPSIPIWAGLRSERHWAGAEILPLESSTVLKPFRLWVSPSEGSSLKWEIQWKASARDDELDWVQIRETLGGVEARRIFERWGKWDLKELGNHRQQELDFCFIRGSEFKLKRITLERDGEFAILQIEGELHRGFQILSNGNRVRGFWFAPIRGYFHTLYGNGTRTRGIRCEPLAMEMELEFQHSQMVEIPVDPFQWSYEGMDLTWSQKFEAPQKKSRAVMNLEVNRFNLSHEAYSSQMERFKNWADSGLPFFWESRPPMLRRVIDSWKNLFGMN